MKVCFYGFSSMDFKGEEINEVKFLKDMINELNARACECFYLYNKGGVGINEEKLFEKLEIDATRFCIDKYTDFSYEIYQKFKEEEIFDIYEFNYNLQKITSKKDNSSELKYTVYKVLENIKELDDTEDIDLFIFWGNSIFSNIIRAYCKKENKKFYNMENGYFRPYTLMVDSEGVNFESSIPRNRKFYETINVDEERLSKYLKQPESAYEEKDTTNKLRKEFYEYFGIAIEPKEYTKIQNKKEKNIIINEDEYIYIPFQLETDSQIIKHSKNIKTMKSLVEITTHAINNYNNTTNSNIKVKYKVHPLYKSEINIIDIEGIIEFCELYENVEFLLEGDNTQLIEEAKAIITINSTVGFEALQKHKPLIVLGDAFYGIDGISYVCENLKNLEKTLIMALENDVNIEYIDKFIYYLRFEYFSEIFRYYPDEKSIKRLVDKFLGVGIKNEEYCEAY